MLRINNIKVQIDDNTVNLNKEAEYNLLTDKVRKLLKGQAFEMDRIVKKSIDARDKSKLMYLYSVDIKCQNEQSVLKKINNNNIMYTKSEKYQFPVSKIDSDIDNRPIIIGAGPAGYFCGLYLARQGFRPIIFERGKKVEERSKDVESFWNGNDIKPNSNVSFGEGGAGTFSDGKLNTGIKDPCGRIQAVLDDFITFGAPEEIRYLNKPHIGTDYLKSIMKEMREEIINLGGEIHFNSTFITYHEDNNGIEAIISQNNQEFTYKTNALILAIGHSARDTFRNLHKEKLPMEPKAFAIGLRIEHPRDLIQKSQYGDSKLAMKLPSADYKMTFRSSEGRSVYSFCMCPGGFVVNASSGENQAVVNGMSNHGRDEINSNSAIVCNVTPEDFELEGFSKYGELAGIYFQEKYEELAFKEGKGKIPVQTFGDYEANVNTTNLGSIRPNLKGDYSLGNLNNCLPAYVNNAIIEGIHYYGKKLSGFDDSCSVLSGIETRTSSPVRIPRDEEYMSSVRGIFPCGEGAGYAGGITSAAVDGIKIAEAVAKYILGE